MVEEEMAAAVADETPAIWEIPMPNVPSEYRELAARLCSPSLESEPIRSVLLVGATVAAIEAISLPALAVALSARGSVLWVDPRCRRPVTASIGADGVEAPGLRELAAGEAGWDEAIRKTSLADVSFVGCGVGPLNAPGEASLTAGLESRLGGCSLVLVDGGLALEAAALAAVCQSVGLAVAIGHDRRGEINNALAALADAGVVAPPGDRGGLSGAPVHRPLRTATKPGRGHRRAARPDVHRRAPRDSQAAPGRTQESLGSPGPRPFRSTFAWVKQIPTNILLATT